MTRNSKPGRRAGLQVKGSASRGGVRPGGVPPIAWLGLAGLLLVAVGLFLARQSLAGPTATTGSAPVRVSGKPNLAVDRETIDFGRVPLDKPVKATFKLTNKGDRPLTLNGIPTVQAVKGCWPPQAVVGSTTIQPGASTDLSMEFMMHAGMEGQHDFLVQVKSNDPDQAVKDLHVLSDWEK